MILGNMSTIILAAKSESKFGQICADVGCRIIQDFGAKQQVMELMTHESAEVRYHALAAVQNYMTNAWDF